MGPRYQWKEETITTDVSVYVETILSYQSPVNTIYQYSHISCHPWCQNHCQSPAGKHLNNRSYQQQYWILAIAHLTDSDCLMTVSINMRPESWHDRSSHETLYTNTDMRHHMERSIWLNNILWILQWAEGNLVKEWEWDYLVAAMSCDCVRWDCEEGTDQLCPVPVCCDAIPASASLPHISSAPPHISPLPPRPILMLASALAGHADQSLSSQSHYHDTTITIIHHMAGSPTHNTS